MSRAYATHAAVEVSYMCPETDAVTLSGFAVAGPELRKRAIWAEGGDERYGAGIVVMVPCCPSCGGSHEVEL